MYALPYIPKNFKLFGSMSFGKVKVATLSHYNPKEKHSSLYVESLFHGRENRQLVTDYKV
jgi:hypothetical protein